MSARVPAPSEFAAHFRSAALRTIRLARLFGDADLDLRPGEGSLSTAEQINHVCASNNFLRGVLEDESAGVDLFARSYAVGSMAAALESLTLAMEEVLRAAKTVSEEHWAEEIEPFGPDWRMSRGQMAYLMLDHESHHRGQLTVYARVAGKTPPLLYAPVEESVPR